MSGGPFPFGFSGGSGGSGEGSGDGPGNSSDPFGFGGVNIFAELQRLMSWQGGPVNWDMARQVAEQSIGTDDPPVTDAEKTAVVEAGRPRPPLARRGDGAPRGGWRARERDPHAVDPRDAAGLADARRPHRRQGRRRD